MPAKKKTTKTNKTTPAKKAATKSTKTTNATASVDATVEKAEQQVKSRWHNFNLEDNLHMILGVILLIVGLYLLREFIVGLLFLTFGILFVTGYFEKNHKKKK